MEILKFLQTIRTGFGDAILGVITHLGEETVFLAIGLLFLWCIDKKTTNPCRLYEKLGIEQPTEEQIRLLQEEGRLKPVFVGTGVDEIKLELSPNATYLITVE